MITVWHLVSVVCLIASTASANATAKSQHASAVPYGACILTGIVLGVIPAAGNLACANLVAKAAIRERRRSVRIALLSALSAASVGWIVLAGMSGRWVAAAVLQILLQH